MATLMQWVVHSTLKWELQTTFQDPFSVLHHLKLSTAVASTIKSLVNEAGALKHHV